MSLPIKVNINPELLVWARAESGIAVEKVADKLELDVPKILEWESNGKDIPFKALETIARLYKRQIATFFLLGVPPKIKKPKDYRNLAGSDSGFSPDTLLAIRRTSRYLQVAAEILGNSYWNNQYQWIKNFDGKHENSTREAAALREILDASIDEQIKQRNLDTTFRYWRNKIEEKLGIFVFQFSMPESEIDGFSYAFDDFPFAIVVNNKKPAARKIFTLFHELAHILKHRPGVCITDFNNFEEKQSKIELECNDFAGKFLVPSESIKATRSVDDIFEYARLFNVSSEVYLRRLFDKGIIENNEFFDLLKAVRDRSRSFSRKKKTGFPSQLIISKSTRGNKLFDMVVSSALSNKVSFSVASDILGLKIGNIRI